MMVPRFFSATRCLFLMVFLCLVGLALPSWAQNYEQQYGKELKSVPYVIRVKFENDYGRPWSKASYEERFNFLYAFEIEEYNRKIVENDEKNRKEMIKMEKEIARQNEKDAEAQKEFERQMIKYDKKAQEDAKKLELQMKSIEQKQKIQAMRAKSQSR